MEWNWLWHCSSLYKTPHRQDDFQAFMLRWKKYPNASKTRPRLIEHSENIWTFRVQACRLLSYVSFALFFHVRECVPLSALPQWPQIFWSSEASVTKRPAAGQWDTVSPPLLCGKVLRPFQKLASNLPYIVSPPRHRSQGSHRQISGSAAAKTLPRAGWVNPHLRRLYDRGRKEEVSKTSFSLSSCFAGRH